MSRIFDGGGVSRGRGCRRPRAFVAGGVVLAHKAPIAASVTAETFGEVLRLTGFECAGCANNLPERKPRESGKRVIRIPALRC